MPDAAILAADYTAGMRQVLRTVMWFALVGLAIAGCGNKGDLVLPDAPPEPAEAPAPR